MRTLARCFVAIALATLAVAGAIALLRGGIYGLTIFMVVPAVIGGLASWVVRPTTGAGAAGLGALAATVGGCLLLAVRLEGLICVMMALPLAVPLGALGGWLVFAAGSSQAASRSAAMLALLPPATLAWDVKASSPVFEVRSSIVVDATPQQVWKHVVSFSDLPDPHEWYFRAGLAYPKRARIVGSGPGAVRYCEFSTGPFVEPIEVWDAPRLLQFRVTENPAPMNEWSPYANLFPKHLHGYLVSKRGQFQLTPLANGRTLLEGATWYQHGLWPATYWRWWSEAIIHRIHLRVLNHIRTLAEKDGGYSWSDSIGLP
jgi:hypothetical protein